MIASSCSEDLTDWAAPVKVAWAEEVERLALEVVEVARIEDEDGLVVVLIVDGATHWLQD